MIVFDGSGFKLSNLKVPRDCPDCNGEGNSPIQPFDICETCNGVGLVENEEIETKKCTCGAVKCGSLKHSNWCDLE